MSQTKSRFCGLCKEYVYMDCENEIVFPSTGKCAYKYWLKPEFWEINKRSDTYLAHFIQDIYLRCTDFIKI